jgi:hypothetical protein
MRKDAAEKYELLRKKCPSLMGNSVFMFLYRIVFGLLAFVCLAVGIYLLISSTSYKGLSTLMNVPATPNEDYLQLLKYGSICICLLGFLFLIVSSLAAKLITRNNYIKELDQWAKDQLQPENLPPVIDETVTPIT